MSSRTVKYYMLNKDIEKIGLDIVLKSANKIGEYDSNYDLLFRQLSRGTIVFFSKYGTTYGHSLEDCVHMNPQTVYRPLPIILDVMIGGEII